MIKYLSSNVDDSLEKLRTTIFVDFEAWFYGCANQYQSEPDVIDWFNHAKRLGQIENVLFFADFSHDAIKAHISKLRSISNCIIDCSKSDKAKEYTDFIMLDHIYQRLLKQPDTEQFILFTGDNHFQSVVAFLRHYNNRTVGIYAVNGSLSNLLAETASWHIKVIPSNKKTEQVKHAIMKNLRWTQEKQGLIPTFTKTVNVVSQHHMEFTFQEVSKALSELISQGVIRQDEAVIPLNGTTVKKLVIANA